MKKGIKYTGKILSLVCLAIYCHGQPCHGIDSSLLDVAYPVMIEWAKAGVEGGIPATEKMKVLCRISPSANLQKELNRAGAKGKCRDRQ